MSRLFMLYKKELIFKLQKLLDFPNIMQVPRIEKITLNMGVGRASKDKKEVDLAFQEMKLISGQTPIITKAKKSIAGFKIREGWPIGCKVTLRRNRMYEFLDRLVNIVIPRIRDFRGLNRRSFDGRGNYSLGIKEQISFPEIDYDKVRSIHGIDITISTTAKDDATSEVLLKSFDFPLKS